MKEINVNNEDVLTVYWAPGKFIPKYESWAHLYQEPVNFLADLNQKRNKESAKADHKGIFSCPSYIDTMKNVFVFKSNFDIEVKFPHDMWDREYGKYPVELGTSPINATIQRANSIIDHADITVNMSWLMFASEPVNAVFTAPYFPSYSPVKGAMLSPGQFDIGLWYRDYNLDYHIPKGTPSLKFKENEPLFYVNIDTDKRVVFKRYEMTSALRNIADECAQGTNRYKANVPLLGKYKLAKQSKMSERILFHIKNNVIE